MTSFRVIRESKSARALRQRREHNARYSSLRDTFHLPFPASATEYVERHGSPQNKSSLCDEKNNDSLSILPHEISDLILSKLSPVALAAARTTCRAWWTMIMSNAWILASVLAFEHSLAVRDDMRSGNDEISLRRLQRHLDRERHMYTDYEHPDAWPLRFRRRVMDFSIPQVCKHVHQKYELSRSEFSFADFSTIGRFIVFLVTNMTETAAGSQQTQSVVFYQLALSGEPLYVGSLPCPKSIGPLSIVRGVETQPNKLWSITIGFGGTTMSYSIATREAYAKSDAPFVLTQLETELASIADGQGSNLVTESSNDFATPQKPWQILTYLPYTTGEDTGSVRKIALAKHVLSGTLWVVRLGPPLEMSDSADNDKGTKGSQHPGMGYYDGTGVVTAVALIVPPKDKWIYRNIAVASFASPTRVAVIWQENLDDHQHTEMYFHDIPITIFYRTKEEGTAEQRYAYVQRLTGPQSSPLPENLGPSGLIVNVHGKRVQSLGWQMGGIHASSPIWNISLAKSFKHCLDTQQALGGLQVTQGAKGLHDEFIDNQKCFVWGPNASERHHISLVVFDFRYEGSAKPSPIRIGFPAWQANPVNPPDFHFTHCACALHDDGYTIVLPDTACTTLVATTAPSSTDQARKQIPGDPSIKTFEPCPPYGSEEYKLKEQTVQKRFTALFPKTHPRFLRSFWTDPMPPTLTPPYGSIVHYDPPARKEALERRDEELREHIKEWKREGQSDFDIAQTWLNSRLSGWGAVPKPEGWRDL